MARPRRPRRRARRRLNRYHYVAGVCLLLMLLALLAGYFFAESPPPNAVARVLFSETASCNAQERLLVAGVIRNRVDQPAFGNLPTLEAVVLQRGAFSCVNDKANTNWNKSAHPFWMTSRERSVWQECLSLSESDIPPAIGPSGRPLLYYHDKSISKPPSWDNAQWRAIKETETPRLIFYSIIKAQ